MLLFSAANLTDAFTGDPGVQQHFRQYLLGQMVGVLPLMLSQQLSAFLSLENQSRRTITASSKGWEPGMGERKNHAKQTKTELYFVEPGLRAESFAERLRRKQARHRHHR